MATIFRGYPDNRFYIATPIYYANDVPHIGHTGTTVFADITARYQRLLGKETFFLTGTDEHGQKVLEAAEKAGKDPKQFVDELAVKWQQYWKKLNISNDYFIQTTSDGHKKYATELLQKLWDSGDVYKGIYEGTYCWGCEEFKTESQLVDGKCPEHRPDQIEHKKEENYFFKISKYIPEIKKLIESGELSVEPENKKNEMLARINEGIQDMSISRAELKWGIPLPWDNSQVSYVWVEALMNYYTAPLIVGKPELWPNTVNFLGKGNNWFHSIVWPALLLSLKLPLPKSVYVHGYYNVGGQKMGKSLGNVISPQQLIDKYGVDGTRYLLAASMPFKDDSDVTFEWFDEKYNSDLANGIGNLVSRVVKLIGVIGVAPEYGCDISEILENNAAIKDAYDNFRLHDVVTEIQKLVSTVDEYFSTNEPWKKEGEEKAAIVQAAAKKVYEVALLIEPIMPATASEIKSFLKLEKPATPLFKRV